MAPVVLAQEPEAQLGGCALAAPDCRRVLPLQRLTVSPSHRESPSQFSCSAERRTSFSSSSGARNPCSARSARRPSTSAMSCCLAGTRSLSKSAVSSFAKHWTGSIGIWVRSAEERRRHPPSDYFGVTRNSPPGLASSSIHSAPSGPTSTSRIAVADAPAFGGRRSALAVERDAVERLRRHPADERRALPLRKHRAVVEHEIARRDDRRPVDHRLGQVRPRVRTRDRRAVVVGRVGDERPAVVLAGLDQVQLVAASRAVLEFPQPAVGRERQTVRRPMTGGPGFRRRQIRSLERVRADRRARSWPLPCRAAD